jgi:hypothetical protein
VKKRHQLLDGLNDAGRVAIALAYDWDGGRVESNDSGEWIRARLGEGAGELAAAAAGVGAAGGKAAYRPLL